MTVFAARLGALAVIGLAAALTAPAARAADADPVVAVVNGTEIRESQLKDVRSNLPPQVAQQATMRQVTEIAVNNKLVTDDARKEGLDKDPEVKKAVRAAEDYILRQAWARKRARADIPLDQIKKRYDQLLAGYKPFEEVHAHHILLETEDQAKQVIADLRGGASFEDIAKSKSKDPSGAKNGGDLGFFAKDQMVPEFADAAFALQPGQVSSTPVKTQFGWHVIRVDERRMSTAPSFDDPQTKDMIRQQIAQQNVQDAVKALVAKSKIEIKVADTPATGAPIAPAGQAAPGAISPAPAGPPTGPTVAPGVGR